MKKAIVIGGNGTIGKAASRALSEYFEVKTAGRSTGDYRVEINDISSIQSFLEEIGTVDALVCCAGQAKWEYFDQLTEEDFYLGINSKLMGQVNLVRLGLKHLTPGGSIALTTGILGEHPVEKTAAAAMVNGGIHSFVKAAVLELKDQKRVNVIAPGLVEDSYDKLKSYMPGHIPVTMHQVGQAYLRATMGKMNGELLRVY